MAVLVVLLLLHRSSSEPLAPQSLRWEWERGATALNEQLKMMRGELAAVKAAGQERDAECLDRTQLKKTMALLAARLAALESLNEDHVLTKYLLDSPY